MNLSVYFMSSDLALFMRFLSEIEKGKRIGGAYEEDVFVSLDFFVAIYVIQ